MRSYLFKSTKEAVINCKCNKAVQSHFSGIESNGIDPTTLTVLESILSGEDFYNIHERGEYEIIKKVDEENDNSPMFVSSSKNLIDNLKKLNKEEIQQVLSKWCQTQEMAMYGWTPEKATHIINWLISTSHDQNSPEEKIILFLETDQNTVSL